MAVWLAKPTTIRIPLQNVRSVLVVRTQQYSHRVQMAAKLVWLVSMITTVHPPQVPALHVYHAQQVEFRHLLAKHSVQYVQLGGFKLWLVELRAWRVAPDDMWTPPAAIKPRTASPVWRVHTRRVAAMWQRRTAPSVRWGASHSRRGGHLLATATTVHTVSIRVRQARLRALRARRDASHRHQLHRYRRVACVWQDNFRIVLVCLCVFVVPLDRWQRSRVL
jgi:hypothetical protein